MVFTAYLHGLRPIEILLLTYLISTTVLMSIRRRYLPYWPIHIALRCVIGGMIYSTRWISIPGILRDWYPVAGYFFLYTEIRLLNRLVTQQFFDKSIIQLEERLFRGQPSMYVIERLPYLWLADLLYVSYLSYYVMIPAVCLLLYALGQYAAFRETTFIMMLALQACSWIYIFCPVASPYYEFPRVGKPYSESPFYRLIMKFLQHGSSKGSAFPSSHVTIGLVILMCLGAFNVPISIVFAPFVVGLVVATVYGRFHYAIDSFAGIAVAVVSFSLGHWLYAVLQGL